MALGANRVQVVRLVPGFDVRLVLLLAVALPAAYLPIAGAMRIDPVGN